MWRFPLYTVGEPLDWEALEERLGWFRAMRNVPQDAEWHGEGDVFIHTKMVVESLIASDEFSRLEVQEQHILFAAAMMHDIEKRSTTTTEVIDGRERIISPGHAKKGELTARTILYKEIPTPFKVRELICKLVRLHGLPLWAIEKEDPEKSVIASSLECDNRLLAILATADMNGRICNDQEELLLKIALFKELCKEHNCYDKPATFASEYGRFLYLTRSGIARNYEPYDDRKFTVNVMCALPGTGKDTYIGKNFDLPVLSLDDIRRENKILPTDRKGNGRVIQEAKEKARAFMRARQSFVFNATNISRDMRGKWISLFLEYGARVRIIYLEVPYGKLISQNRNREHMVPENVLEQLLGKLELPGYTEAHEIAWQVSD